MPRVQTDARVIELRRERSSLVDDGPSGKTVAQVAMMQNRLVTTSPVSVATVHRMVRDALVKVGSKMTPRDL